MTSDGDIYVAKLREVFISCDVSGRGYLQRPQLELLCTKLQLEEQGSSFVAFLLRGRPSGEIGFEEFKDGFVRALADNLNNMEEGKGEKETADQHENRVKPKYETKQKKYGRHSKPENHGKQQSTNQTSKSGVTRERSVESQDGQSEDNSTEMFEAEGQMNLSVAELENVVDPVCEEEHLRLIWKELGVGANGYLTIDELSKVCQHIGMDEMNKEELGQLFERLDADSDGLVSFKEFLQGLFQHGGPASTSPVRPMSTPRQKLRFTPASDSEGVSQTPAVFTAGSLFSVLDTNKTGFVNAETVIDLWDNLGVTNGAEILQFLEFDLHNSVSLVDLSYALETEMRQVEEDNAIYQAALASYQAEMKYSKLEMDQQRQENDKLRSDLGEANSRINMLVREADDRQASLEKSRENELIDVDKLYMEEIQSFKKQLEYAQIHGGTGVADEVEQGYEDEISRLHEELLTLKPESGSLLHSGQILSIEKKYQEQIKSLQSSIEEERTSMSQQSAKLQQKLDQEMERMKQEEDQLKHNLSHTQEELEKLEGELAEMSERCVELQKQNQRQQRDLESAADLGRKLEEMESDHSQFVMGQHRFIQEKLQQLEVDNKELKDRNDELVLEVEELRQQTAGKRQRSKGKSKVNGSREPKRTGSVLSDYSKPFIPKYLDGESAKDEMSDGAEDNGDEDVTDENHNSGHHLPQSLGETDSASKQMKEDMQELQHKVDDLMREKESLQSSHEQELESLKNRFEEERQAIEQMYKLEITDLEDAFLKEKENLQEEFQNEKEQLADTHKKDVETQLEELGKLLREEVDQEKRELVIKAESEKNLMEQRLRDEMSEDMQSQLQKQKEDVEQQLAELESIRSKGESGLTGKLREDFDSLLKEHKEKVEERETAKADEKLQKLKEQLQQEQEAAAREQLEKLKKQLKGQESAAAKEQLVKWKEEVKAEESRAAEEQLQKWKEEQEAALMKQQEEWKSQQEKQVAAAQEQWKKQLQLQEKEAADQQLHEMKAQLLEEHQAERDELRTHHEKAVSQKLIDSQTELEEVKQSLQAELDEASNKLQQLQHQVDIAKQEQHRLQQALEQEQAKHKEFQQQQQRIADAQPTQAQLKTEIQTQLEQEFMQQMHQLKSVFVEERDQLEQQVAALQKELEEQRDLLESEEEQRRGEKRQNKNQEGRYKKQLEQLKLAKEALDDEMIRLEEEKNNLKRKVHQLELEQASSQHQQQRMKEEMKMLRAQQQETVTAATASSQQQGQPDTTAVLLEILRGHGQLLDDRTSELKQQLQRLGAQTAGNYHPLQVSHDQLLAENQQLHDRWSQLQGDMLDLQDQAKEADHLKTKLSSRSKEKNHFEDQIDLLNQKLAETSTALALARSEHQRQLQALQDQQRQMVPRSRYDNVLHRLQQKEEGLAELEANLEQQNAETARMLAATQDQHERKVEELEADNKQLLDQLEHSRHLLGQQVTKLKQQCERSTRTDVLVKDLYVENARLMKALFEAEQGKKGAEQQSCQLQSKCGAYKNVLNRVVIASLDQ